jgi:hypothetical protein
LWVLFVGSFACVFGMGTACRGGRCCKRPLADVLAASASNNCSCIVRLCKVQGPMSAKFKKPCLHTCCPRAAIPKPKEQTELAAFVKTVNIR